MIRYNPISHQSNDKKWEKIIIFEEEEKNDKMNLQYVVCIFG